MSSAGDGDRVSAAGHHDDRLARAFDRAARLGIDLDESDRLSERESAAVRAFAALGLDPALDDPAPDTLTEGPAGWGSQPVEPPAVDDRPLRPDAVWPGGPFVRPGAPASVLRADHASDTSDTAGTIGWAGPAEAAPASRTLDHYLLDLLALAVATGAFVSPWAWLLVVTVGALVGATVRSFALHGSRPVPLLRRAARRMLAWLRPRSAIWLPVIATRTVLLAVAVPGLACALWWVFDQGRDGAFVAGRLGVWAHGPRTAAAIVCFMLVAGVGEAHQRRASQVGRAAGRGGTASVVALALATVVVAALVVTLVPRAGAGRLAGADGLGWAPGRVRDDIDRVRDDLVAAELHAAAGCLSDRQGVTWRVTYTAANPLGDADVARLSLQDGLPAPGELATAAAAIHDQLAPWVEGIELRVADSILVALDRGLLPSGRPVVDPAVLVDAATVGSGLLADGAEEFDRAAALSCSAAPIP